MFPFTFNLLNLSPTGYFRASFRKFVISEILITEGGKKLWDAWISFEAENLKKLSDGHKQYSKPFRRHLEDI